MVLLLKRVFFDSNSLWLTGNDHPLDEAPPPLSRQAGQEHQTKKYPVQWFMVLVAGPAQLRAGSWPPKL
jgi:hypothetical protein